MKKRLLSFLALFIITSSACSAQNITLWGTTSGGNSMSYGNIFSFNPGKDSISDKYDFTDNGTYPYGNLLLADNGKYYGMTSAGGTNKTGVIFTFNALNNSYVVIHNFDSINGAIPYGSLVQATNGLLYGVTSIGGLNKMGVIFSIDPSTNVFTKLYDFDYTHGGEPMYCTLIQASNGLLYGTASWGGAGYGAIFSYDPSSNNYKEESILVSSNSNSPLGTLLQANDGNLYGMSNSGGLYNEGSIFRFDPVSKLDTDVYDFADSEFPTGGFIQATNGLLYAMTPRGGLYDSGKIFSFNITNYSYVDLYDFHSNTGTIPYGNLLQSTNGKLYGMTSAISYYGQGGIFSFDPLTKNYSLLHEFEYTNDVTSDGAIPYGSLIQSNNGLLYGMTLTGGVRDLYGTIFSIDTLGIIFNVVHHCVPRNGWNPRGVLLDYGNGKLYGLCPNGGENGLGVIYCYSPDSSSYNVLHDFTDTDGAFPFGSFFKANNGFLYATTSEGGKLHYGNILSFNTVTNAITDLFEFNDTTGYLGSQYSGYPLQGSNGLFYGLTNNYGVGNFGGIYSFNANNNEYTSVYRYTSSQAADAYGSLLQANNGLLYGMSIDGSNNQTQYGTIFSLNTSTNAYTILHNFGPTTGDGAWGNIIQANNGLLYGLTQGGNNGYGAIFSYDLTANIYTDIYDMDSIHGYEPLGSLLQASDGKLYGMTYKGGLYGHGVIFSFDPITALYTDLLDFNYKNGSNPIGSLIEENATGIYQLPADNVQLSIYPNPSSDFIHLSITQPQEQSLQLSLYNILGQQVWAADLGTTKQANITIPVTTLVSGVYILKVNSGGATQEREVVVAR